MGKSSLLEYLAQSPEFAFFTARSLLHRSGLTISPGDDQVLVIDALDELSAQKDGDAVDLVLRRLGELGYPRFILSCRVADWRSATGLQAISEHYDQKPVELHLEPFSDDDAITFLTGYMSVEAARSVVTHFDERGLQDFFGNPQTLELIARVAGDGTFPETRSDLFQSAIEVLRLEHRDEKADNQPARDVGLDAAGAAFAAIIVTGSDAVVRKATVNGTVAGLALAEIERLPGGSAIRSVLDTRLFKANGGDRFSYWHRRIGEFLGARWLSGLANSRRKRARLLALFQSDGLVPANLRGIHAWLALDPALTPTVIAADPIGVIEYGDADHLGTQNARLLLHALKELSISNPRFRDLRTYSVKSLAQPALADDLRELINSTDTQFALRLLIIESLQRSKVASTLADDLRTLLLDTRAVFAIRSACGKALIDIDCIATWQHTIQTLLTHLDDHSLRLAVELIDKIGYGPFDDELIINIVMTYGIQERRATGRFSTLKRHVPIVRIDGILDGYVDAINRSDNRQQYRHNQELNNFAYHLISRRVAAGDVDPAKLYAWLDYVDEAVNYDKGARAQLETFFQQDHAVRRALQRRAVLELPVGQSVHHRFWQLSRSSAGLIPSEEDVIALLKALNPTNRNDVRWRDVLQLARHDGKTGADAREAARPFAAERADLLRWLDRLGAPHISTRQIRGARRKEKQRRRHIWKLAQNQKHFVLNFDKIRSGDFESIAPLATAYLGQFDDIGSENVPAHLRIEKWVGNQVNEAAQIGFESWLIDESATPSADEIVAGVIKGYGYNAANILVAGLAERQRRTLGFTDVPHERLLAGLFELRRTKIDNHAGIDGLEEVIEEEVRKRGLWIEAMRRYHEPQLRARRTHVDGLYALMRNSSLAPQNVELAAEWLSGFHDLPVEPEAELVDRLLASKRHDVLRSVASVKKAFNSETHRRNWDAVALITDFEATVYRLEGQGIEPELLWHLRDRTGGTGRDYLAMLRTDQLEWMIATFRYCWPFVSREVGLSIGNTNSFDATEYITALIGRLGNDGSAKCSASFGRLITASPDGYTEIIKSVAAEQRRIRVESAYVPPTLDVLTAIARDTQPASAADLQAYMVDELKVVQAKVHGDDAESWRGFFDDNRAPHGEEWCRDHLLGLLRQGSQDVILDPETHVAGDKEVDITCSAGSLRMPIEIKGQWHPALWHAADTQLASLYARDWRAEKRGIYLVMWFGPDVPLNKKLHKRGKGLPMPQSPDELRELLVASSDAARDGLIRVIVIDLARD